MMQSPDPFVTTMRSWMELFMHRSMRNYIRFSKDNGLSMSQMGAMFHIRHGSNGVSDIGDDLGVTSAAASQMLERLVQQGLIVRSEDPNDRRSKHLVLTDKGQEILHEGILARQKWIEELAELLTDEEKDQALGVLQILVEKTSQLENIPELEQS
jgi:DNA-binding MarR family transcriptional regulator